MTLDKGRHINVLNLGRTDEGGSADKEGRCGRAGVLLGGVRDSSPLCTEIHKY